MLNLAKELIGSKVSIRYIPVPYLGRGIVEPITVEGLLDSIVTMNGRNYIVIKDEEGKVLISKDIMDLELIEEASGEAPEVEPEAPAQFTTRRRV